MAQETLKLLMPVVSQVNDKGPPLPLLSCEVLLPQRGVIIGGSRGQTQHLRYARSDVQTTLHSCTCLVPAMHAPCRKFAAQGQEGAIYGSYLVQCFPFLVRTSTDKEWRISQLRGQTSNQAQQSLRRAGGRGASQLAEADPLWQAQASTQVGLGAKASVGLAQAATAGSQVHRHKPDVRCGSELLAIAVSLMFMGGIFNQRLYLPKQPASKWCRIWYH